MELLDHLRCYHLRHYLGKVDVTQCSCAATSTLVLTSKATIWPKVTSDEYCEGSLSEYTYKTQCSWMNMSVIRMWLRPLIGHRMWHKMYKHLNNTGTVSQATAQWSSPEGTSHMVHMEVLHTGSRSCALQDTWDIMWLTPTWHGQMKHFCHNRTFGISLSDFNTATDSGNNTSNGAIKEVGCSWSHLQHCNACELFLK